jgi:hypothetical protein
VVVLLSEDGANISRGGGTCHSELVHRVRSARGHARRVRLEDRNWAWIRAMVLQRTGMAGSMSGFGVDGLSETAKGSVCENGVSILSSMGKVS